MRTEQWEYITSNWGTDDPVVMENIAKIKDEDETEFTNLNKQVEDRDRKILDLTHQNVDLNKTNMNLILRLTDPKLPPIEKEEPEYKAPAVTDWDAFVK